MRRVGLLSAVFVAVLLPSLAVAQDRPSVVADSYQAAPSPKPETPANFTGEWGGLRTRLRDSGVDLAAGYISEAAWNVAGGKRARVGETGELDFGATIDAGRLLGVRGGTFQATITYRRGRDLGADAGLGVLQEVQEIYGGGQTWRLTQFWYQQSFAGGHADVKLGRLAESEDFAVFSCAFQNLSFCGAQPGNLAGDYWYNWPISQWGARARIRSGRFYFMAGAFEVNPRNLDNRFTIGYFHGATGVLVPVEIGFTPRLGAPGLAGAYRTGAWYNSATAFDVGLDLHGKPRAVTGLDPLQHDGRYGVYALLQQQLTGTVRLGKGGPEATSGLVAFLNITQTDRATTVTDNQVAAGITLIAPFSGRAKDEIGFAVARTHVNGRSSVGLAPGAIRPDAEYAAELAYSVNLFGWLTVRPNIQYIVDPGGYRAARDVVVLGMKTSAIF